MSRRALRALCVVSLVVVIVGGDSPAWALRFVPARRASAPYAWNPGKALVATDTRLLSIWASDCPPPTGKCASEDGPHMGVFVQRSPVGATPPTWSAPLRLSPSTVHAERASIAASGSTVIASWVTQTSYRRYKPSAPRVLWVRVSTNNGKTWRRPRRLTSPLGRVDYPRLAVRGGRLFAVWTSADSGEIRVAWSDDLGNHWPKTTIGTTTSTPSGNAEGFAGFPDIGASGDNVAVAWISNDKGVQQVLTSAVGGDDLVGATPTQLSGRSPNDGQHYPAVGGAADPTDPRIAIAYTTGTGLALRIFDGAALGAPATVFTWDATVGGVVYTGGYGPAVLPLDTTQIGVAVAGCRRNTIAINPCYPFAPGARIDVLYRVTADGGATWSSTNRLTDASTAPYRTNDEPSLAITGTTHRVSFDRYEPTFRNYDVWLRSSR